LGVAVRIELDEHAAIADADVVVTALQARPLRIKKIAELLRGVRADADDRGFDAAARAAAEQAGRQAHPLANVPGDAEWRQEMVPVCVRRTLVAAVRDAGPVHIA